MKLPRLTEAELLELRDQALAMHAAGVPAGMRMLRLLAEIDEHRQLARVLSGSQGGSA